MPTSYSIGEQFETFIDSLIASGRYHSKSEVIRAALRLLQDEEQLRQLKLDELRNLVDEGLSSGPATPLDVEAIKKRGRARLREKHPRTTNGKNK